MIICAYQEKLADFRKGMTSLVNGVSKLSENLGEGKLIIAAAGQELQAAGFAAKQAASWSDAQKHDTACIDFALSEVWTVSSKAHKVHELSQCMPADYQPDHMMSKALAALRNRDDNKHKLVWLLGSSSSRNMSRVWVGAFRVSPWSTNPKSDLHNIHYPKLQLKQVSSMQLSRQADKLADRATW